MKPSFSKKADFSLQKMAAAFIMILTLLVVFPSATSLFSYTSSVKFSDNQALFKIECENGMQYSCLKIIKDCDNIKADGEGCSDTEKEKWVAYQKVKDCDADKDSCDESDVEAWEAYKKEYVYGDSSSNPGGSGGGDYNIDSEALKKILEDSSVINSETSIEKNYNNLDSYSKKTYDRLNDISIGSYPAIKYLELKSIENGINPMLAFYVLHRESRGVPNAISYTGCAGLFQFCYDTAHKDYKDFFGSSGEYCKNQDPNTCENDLRLNSAKSIEAGTLYLSRLSRSYNNNIVLILTAYNAGPGIANMCKSESDDKIVECVLREADNYYTKEVGNPNKDEELKNYITEISSNYASTIS